MSDYSLGNDDDTIDGEPEWCDGCGYTLLRCVCDGPEYDRCDYEEGIQR